ncbi:DUF1152 domain-containing protein [Catenulispora sp. NF23]|uniref:DUF1152 domain-containing protein n=1 Tax=Catenulispora pinistramenti TaxID=2705254 RepID=A0ABS5KLR9_9ACTN|nr:DUF1152 domain-containing protein [Catenulispora pinistramenti]MBS2531468.1 DUF1152 domain-containing protein [Catenulispora pinistramenti]MBS2546994.1 DUF1152 domain-containing protein [Catenulispora pinistramenti]
MTTSSLRDLPLFAALADSQRILVAGAGGGFDILGGLPLALALRERGAEVFLANLTFVSSGFSLDAWLAPDVATVTPTTGGFAEYFPERTLARWLKIAGEPSTVYAFQRTGVRPLTEAYRALVAHHAIDAIVLVDGGTDILMRGDETGLGTPEEDMLSLATVAGLAEVPVRLVVSIGFGIDAHHGVNHVQVLENLADLDADGAYLGAFSIPRASREGSLYLDAVAYAQENTPMRPSIVHGQIASAMLGVSGNVHFTERTHNSVLFVNPLMAMYFTATVEGLAARHLYLPELADTRTFGQITTIIGAFRDGLAERRIPRQFPH